MPDAQTVAIGAYRNNGNGIGNYAGHVRIYEWHDTAWVQKGVDIDGEAAGDTFGYSVSMPDAQTVAIGAPGNDGNGPNAGHARIFEWNGTAWVQKGMDIDGETANNESGWAVSMPDAQTVAVGAQWNGGNGVKSGHVRIYAWNGTTWVQKGIDIDGEAAYDYSGFSVSMPDAQTVAIGAPGNDGNGNNSGHVRVYGLSTITGITENTFGQQFTVYPNPTNGQLSIDLGDNMLNVTVIVRNALGKETLRKTYNSANLIELTIDGEAGIYYVEIATMDKKELLKVIKK